MVKFKLNNIVFESTNTLIMGTIVIEAMIMKHVIVQFQPWISGYEGANDIISELVLYHSR